MSAGAVEHGDRLGRIADLRCVGDRRIPAPTPVTGAAGTRKHPRLAANANGEVLVVWTEGTAWARGGSLAWQAFDASGHPTTMTGEAPGVGVWSFGTPAPRRDGGFVILY
jgi:hypothetical protein